ncbi:MAG: putative ABC transporter permease [Christensenellales bacterium]
MNKLAKTFLLGSLAYPFMELFYRGKTHWSMSLAGGASAVIIRMISRVCKKGIGRKCLYSAAAITALEYAVGSMVNKRHAVWDYSRMPFNVKGQICLPFSAAWFLLSAPIVAACTAAKKLHRS